MADPLATYKAKRDFGRTPEPAGTTGSSGAALSFVVQKHAATRLHYDFRLELDGVMLSWAVPKGPSFDPADKRMAVHVEDHPISYNTFEGTIPKGSYGAGTVIVWDRGTWTPVNDPRQGLQDGKLVFTLDGHKLHGGWELIRIKKKGEERQDPWLLFKKRDDAARPRTEYDVITALPDSVVAKPLKPPAEPVRKSPAARTTTTKKTSLPDSLKPQLALLADGVPDGDWIYEIKFDGYRLLTRFTDGTPALMTRNGHDWTDKMPVLAGELAALQLDGTWLDGEIVVIGADGTPDFNALQKAFDGKASQAIDYFVFDAPFLNGEDLRELPLRERRRRVRELLAAHAGGHLRYSDDFDGGGGQVLESVCKMGMEGVIAKRADAPYRSERNESWLKLKCRRRQEFVVVGYTDRANASGEVGSLLLGVHDDDGRLVSVGSVGTGWDQAEARALFAQLAPLRVEKTAFEKPPPKGRWSRRAAGAEAWVRPQLVAEVEFADWTPDAQIRHAVYVSLRSDKPAKVITREPTLHAAARQQAPQAKAAAPASQPAARIGIKVTHPERVVDTSTGLTKIDLVRYYDSVADWILPHLKARPVSLVRGPNGIGGQLFFQKHGEKIGVPGIRELDAALWPGHDALLEIATREALLGAAQMNVIELHTWNSTTRGIDSPDRMIFDLDPGEGIQWQQVQEAAVLTRALLDELGLKAWLKTSGGKGLHLVVPLAPKLGYDAVKDFSQAIVQHLAGAIPDRFSAKSGAGNRVGKIFVDYLRNGHGATTATAFSARARPGLGVSMPVAWEQLQDLKSGAQWTIATAREYLSFQQQDPWSDYAKTKQPLARAMKKLGFTPG